MLNLFRLPKWPALRLWFDKGSHYSRKEHSLKVLVRDNNIDQALRVLKRKLQREGHFREIRRGMAYEKPSDKKSRKRSEAIRRRRKLERKKAQRQGLTSPGQKPRNRP